MLVFDKNCPEGNPWVLQGKTFLTKGFLMGRILLFSGKAGGLVYQYQDSMQKYYAPWFIMLMKIKTFMGQLFDMDKFVMVGWG